MNALLRSRIALKKVRLGITKLSDFHALMAFNDSGLTTDKALCRAFKEASEKERASLLEIFSRIEF